MRKTLVLSAFLLTAAFAALADEPAGKAQAPAASPGDQSDSVAAQQDADSSRSYCVTQTGTHVLGKNGVCSYGTSVSRQEWQDRGGMSTSDFVRKGIP